MRLPLLLPVLATALGAAHDTPPAAALKIGSPAPALQASRWVKGKAALEPGKVTVVEFWATWCGPCRQTIPHLTELARKYAGKVTFIGMDVWERGDAIDKTVDAFVKDMGDRMAYPVAMDTADGAMARTWMQAAGRSGIPSAFIVDAQGRIAWIGHPMNKMDEALDAILAGKHDLAAAAKADETARAESKARMEKMQAQQKAFLEGLKAVDEARKKKDWAKVLEVAEKAAAETPDFKGSFEGPRIVALIHLDEAKAQALVDQARAEKTPTVFSMASGIAQEEGLPDRWYRLALEVLEAKAKDPKGDQLLGRSLAKLYARLGRPAEAVAAQEKVLAYLRDGKNFPPQFIESAQKDLDTYRAQKAGSPQGAH